MIHEKIIHKSRQVAHRLRQKPEKERRDLLHLLMIIACVLLFAIWTLTLGIGNINKKEAKTKKTRTGLEPFSALKENIKGGFDSLEANLGNGAQ